MWLLLMLVVVVVVVQIRLVADGKRSLPVPYGHRPRGLGRMGHPHGGERIRRRRRRPGRVHCILPAVRGVPALRCEVGVVAECGRGGARAVQPRLRDAEAGVESGGGGGRGRWRRRRRGVGRGAGGCGRRARPR